MEGPAIVGKAAGTADAAHALRSDAQAVSLKLLPYNGGLTGRLLALASSPGRLASIPFTTSLHRG